MFYRIYLTSEYRKNRSSNDYYFDVERWEIDEGRSEKVGRPIINAFLPNIWPPASLYLMSEVRWIEGFGFPEEEPERTTYRIYLTPQAQRRLEINFAFLEAFFHEDWGFSAEVTGGKLITTVFLPNRVFVYLYWMEDVCPRAEDVYSDRPEQLVEAEPEGGSGEDFCFLATACDAEPSILRTLREFRDEILLTQGWGRAFVHVYYRIGPCMADFIKSKAFLKRIVLISVIRPSAFLIVRFKQQH